MIMTTFDASPRCATPGCERAASAANRAVQGSDVVLLCDMHYRICGLATMRRAAQGAYIAYQTRRPRKTRWTSPHDDEATERLPAVTDAGWML